MANQTIKGITIQFDGDTTSLDKALRRVRDEAYKIDSQLKQVNKSLKFNPKNVELLAQKQTLLKQRVEQSEKSLEKLKDVQKQMDAQGVDKSSEAYMRVRREIIETESKLKHFKNELAKTAAQSSKLYRIGDAIQTAGAKATAAGQAFRGLSRAAAGVAVAIGGATYKAATMADDLNTLSKQTGITTDQLQLYAASADLIDVSVESMARSQKKLKRSMLTASEGGSTLAYFQELGVAVTDSNGELRSAQDVFDDTIKALGEMENETQRDAIAMALFGKSASDLNPLIEDGGHTYERVTKLMKENGLDPVSQEALDRANEFRDQIDIIKLVFTQAVQIIGTKIAGYLVPAMEKVTGFFTKIASGIASLSGGSLAKLGGLSGALAALSPALLVAGKVLTFVGGKFKDLALKVEKLARKFPVVGKAVRFLTNPLVAIVAAVTGLGLAIGKSGKSADQLVAIFDNVFKKISAKLPEIIAKVVEIIKMVAQTIVQNIPVILQGLLTLMQALIKAIPTYAPQILNGALNLFGQFVKAIPVIVPQVLAAVKSMVGTIISNIPALAASLFKAALSLGASILKGIKSSLASIPGWFGSIFGQAWSAIKSKFSGWSAFWGGLWGQVKNKFKDIGANIAGAISGAIKSGLNAVIGKVESIINGGIHLINKAIKLANKLPGVEVGLLNDLHLPRLAEGGVLRHAQTVIAGEAGPEAIIPLDKLFVQMDKMAKTIAGTGEGITINVYGAAGQNVNELAAAIEARLVALQKRRSMAWA